MPLRISPVGVVYSNAMSFSCLRACVNVVALGTKAEPSCSVACCVNRERPQRIDFVQPRCSGIGLLPLWLCLGPENYANCRRSANRRES